MRRAGRGAIVDRFFRRAITPASGRAVSMVRSDTRTLIRIANETERAITSGTRPRAASSRDGREQELRRLLRAAEAQLESTIKSALSPEVSLDTVEADVIRSILESTVIVSGLAHDMVWKALRSAASEARS